MGNRNFSQLLNAQQEQGRSVCVGLDSECEKIPERVRSSAMPCYKDDPVYTEGQKIGEVVFRFNVAIVDATKNRVCAYKPNLAFYLAYGPEGLCALQRTIVYIHSIAPEVPVILDLKCADIGNTNLGYAKLAFDYLKADAITVHPYLGAEALAPFLGNPDKGIFVLCRTSNPGAWELQNKEVRFNSRQMVADLRNIPDLLRKADDDGNASMELYLWLAYQVAKHWNKNGNCGLVVGATYPGELAKVRQIVGPDMPILIPGVGAQGGSVEETLQASQGINIINSSRGIIFASPGEDFAEAARAATEQLHNEIKQHQRKG